MVSARHDERLARARCALEGLALGDAFGQRLMTTAHIRSLSFIMRTLPLGRWEYTDDTQMALSIVAVLARHAGIDQDALAQSFADHFEPWRGYGPAMRSLLPSIASGQPWRQAARQLFGGAGSFGNGAAMRVAPLGAFFADDPELAADHARLSAEVTHVHPEAAAGAIAVAVAAAWAWRLREAGSHPERREFCELILAHVPETEVRAGIERARDLPETVSLDEVVGALGNGSRISAQDTVPFVVWCAAKRLNGFEEAVWLTASGLGDMDTTCAMVGGIVAGYAGIDGLPTEWLHRREELPAWPFDDIMPADSTIMGRAGPSGASDLEEE